MIKVKIPVTSRDSYSYELIETFTSLLSFAFSSSSFGSSTERIPSL